MIYKEMSKNTRFLLLNPFLYIIFVDRMGK